MDYNKQVILQEIDNQRLAIEMEKGIREVIEGCKHYKNVDKKFLDKLTDKGFWCWIQKDKYSTRLFVRADKGSTQAKFEVYVSEVMDRKPLTWERILSEFERYRFTERLKTMEQRKLVFEEEKAKVKELAAYVKGQSFLCFDLYKLNHALEDMILFAERAVK